MIVRAGVGRGGGRSGFRDVPGFRARTQRMRLAGEHEGPRAARSGARAFNNDECASLRNVTNIQIPRNRSL